MKSGSCIGRRESASSSMRRTYVDPYTTALDLWNEV
jgi:hypothetical protein